MYQIHAIMVSHNASMFTELAVRSLWANHNPPLKMALSVVDNASMDDTVALQVFLQQRSIPFLQSGFDTRSKYNSHGEILQKFVGENADCDYYLFLDHDVCFFHENVIHRLMSDLNKAGEDVFGINPGWADWYGNAYTRKYRPEDSIRRLHPFCALVKNTQLFRRVVAQFWFGQFDYEYANSVVRWETFELMTQVMLSHGFRHIQSDALLIHLSGVSYSKEQLELHLPRCLELLAEFRNR